MGLMRPGTRVFSTFVESLEHPRSLFCRASHRKTGSHFSGSTLEALAAVEAMGVEDGENDTLEGLGLGARQHGAARGGAA